MDSGNIMIMVIAIGAVVLGVYYFKSKMTKSSSSTSTLAPQQPTNPVDPIGIYKRMYKP